MDAEIRKFLIDRAKRKAPVTYGVIMQQLELDNRIPEHRDRLSYELAEISRNEHKEGRPLLSAMVMYDGLKSFGNGLFNLAEELGYGSADQLARKGFGFDMQKNCIDYWRSSNVSTPTQQPPPKKHPIEFYNAEEIRFLARWAGQVYDKDNEEHVAAKNYIMNSLGKKAQYWSNEIVKRLPDFETFNWRMWSQKGWDNSSGRNRQVARFKPYSWARIYKKGDVDKDIFFTVEADAEVAGLLYKLDYYFESSSNLSSSQKEIVKQNIPEKLRWNTIDLSELVNHTWDSLIDTTVRFISENIAAYDNLIRVAWGNEEVKEVFTNNLRKCEPALTTHATLPELNPSFSGKTTDYIKQAIENKELGDVGEQLVVGYEKRRLRALGKNDLAEKVSVMEDGEGYDLRSFNEDGSEIYIEVKTTTGDHSTPFDMSLNEFLFAERHKTDYKIYRLFNYTEESNSADFYVIQNAVDKLLFQPTAFRVFHRKE